MGIKMNMSSYEIEQDPREEEYGEEVMCSGWNPAIALVCQQHLPAPANSRISIPAYLAVENECGIIPAKNVCLPALTSRPGQAPACQFKPGCHIAILSFGNNSLL